MERRNGYENSLELMMMNFGGNVNDAPYGGGDDPDNQHFIAADGGSENQANTLPEPHWFHCQRTPLNYYEFLTENSSLLEKAPVSDSNFIPGMTEFKTELIYNNPGMASGSQPADSCADMDAWKLNPYLYMFNPDKHEALPNLRCLEQYDGRDLVIKLESSQDQIPAQDHTLWTQDQSKATGNVSRSRPRAKVAASVFLSNPGSNASRQRASSSDRQRRQRIAERLKALQQLLPHPVEGSQASVMDEIINYVKFLQLQMEELSRSKLGGELISVPSMFHEGHQCYSVHEQSLDEPLEETMAKLLKVNSSVATKFLESKGLIVMPMALADKLEQTL